MIGAWRVVTPDKTRHYFDKETAEHVYELLKKAGEEVQPPSFEPID